MTTRTRRLATLPTAFRIIAVTGLVGSALFSQGLMARAETPSIPVVRMVQATTQAAKPAAATPAQAKAGAGATQAKPETVEQRITSLHAALGITTDQETSWNGVALAMRENAAAMDKLMTQHAAQEQKGMTAVDDLKTYQMFAQTHVDGLKNLTAAFDTLYRAMPDAQKKVADAVFQGPGRGHPAANG